jgi:hypothetical protein
MRVSSNGRFQPRTAYGILHNIPNRISVQASVDVSYQHSQREAGLSLPIIFEKVIIGHEGSKSRRVEKFLKFPPAPQFSRAREPEKRVGGASEPPIKTLRSCEPSSLLMRRRSIVRFPGCTKAFEVAFSVSSTS